jgi:hypothetical protein
MPMTLHTAADDLALDHVKQGIHTRFFRQVLSNCAPPNSLRAAQLTYKG